MFRKLLGGAAAGLNFGGERKICITDSILEGNRTSSPSPCLYSSSTTSSTTTTTNSTASANSENKNLRCPRCDSSNTKFCYYNNYNLTQPRHFCKTCRRYWTKGGVLRNVPIGGGCRKSKNTTVSTSVGKSSAGKMKKVVSEIGRSGLGNRFDHDLQSTPILWDSPQSSHLLASLRTNQNPNPNTLSNTVSIKEEVSLLGPRVMNEAAVATSALNARTLGLEPLKQVPSLGLCSSFWENNQDQAQQRQQNNNGFLVGEVQNPGIQELYQSLKSSSPYISDSSAVVISNLGSSSSFSSSSILESAPVTGGELGYWNPAFSSSWSDLPTTNGEYP